MTCSAVCSTGTDEPHERISAPYEVTIDDIARHADIGKGTVYLHWKTRDDLFKAVFEREVRQALTELLGALRQDPGAWRLHRLARSWFSPSCAGRC